MSGYSLRTDLNVHIFHHQLLRPPSPPLLLGTCRRWRATWIRILPFLLLPQTRALVPSWTLYSGNHPSWRIRGSAGCWTFLHSLMGNGASTTSYLEEHFLLRRSRHSSVLWTCDLVLTFQARSMQVLEPSGSVYCTRTY